MKFIIGRAPTCDLVLNHVAVSSKHAFVRRDLQGAVWLKDTESRNGTFVNQTTQEIQETELRDDDLIYFSEEYGVPSALLLRKFIAWEESRGEARGVLSLGQVYRFTQESITIGSALESDVLLPYLDVWPEHALVARQPDGAYTIEDRGDGLTVNGRRVRRATVPLEPHAAVELGGVTMSVNYDPSGRAITLGTERRGFYLTARELTFTIPEKLGTRKLLDRIGFSVMPGEFVGLLGPSGCGKTTLLTCLSGVHRAEGVFYNGRPLAAAVGAGAHAIGYVPQDDLLYPELTVRETLFFSARLRLKARTSNRRIQAKIDQVCATLELVDARTGLDLRDALVGSPERKTLSGGQKKRVNLALELLTDPLVLFLDEPTSGLSSRDTRIVLECLRRLANEKGLPIIITIHQPSLGVYKLLDHALYLKEGRLAYFGPAHPNSVRYFVKSPGEGAGADEIMEAIDEADAEALRKRYAQASLAQKFVRGRDELVTALTRGGDLAQPTPVKPLHLPGQFFYLLRRQLLRRWRDKTSLGIQVVQAPLLGLLLGAAFYHERMNSPLFLCSFIALWFGANATARELVSERTIFQREKRGGVSPAATLLAKLANHGLMLLVQCALLLLGAHVVVDLDLHLAQGALVLWLCGLCGAALGSLISVLSKTEIAATVATPLVLIPLILFGGYLAPYDAMAKPIQVISELMPTRWGYQALVENEKLGPHRTRQYERNDLTHLKDFAEFTKPTTAREPTDAERKRRIQFAEGALALEALALTIATWHFLRRQ